MTLKCQTLKARDPIAAELCETISIGLKRTYSSFVHGQSDIDYTHSGAMPYKTRFIDKSEPAEVYQLYLEKDLPPPFSNSAAKLFRQKCQSDIPWKPPDVQQRFKKLIAKAENDAKLYPNENPVFAKANALLHALRAPKSEGGLGLEYRAHGDREANILQAIDRGYVRCSEFQTVYYGTGRLLGLTMYPLEIPQQQDEKRNDAPHGAIMIVDNVTGNRYFADFQLNDVQKQSPYKEYYVGTAADLFSIYQFNRSMKKHGKDIKLATTSNTLLRCAEAVSPNNAIVLFGLGVYYLERGKWKDAIRYFERTIAARPNHLAALANLCMLTFDKKICDRLPNPAKSTPPQKTTDE